MRSFGSWRLTKREVPDFEDEVSFADWMDIIINSRCTPQQVLFWAPEAVLRRAGVKRPERQF